MLSTGSDGIGPRNSTPWPAARRPAHAEHVRRRRTVECCCARRGRAPSTRAPVERLRVDHGERIGTPRRPGIPPKGAQPITTPSSVPTSATVRKPRQPPLTDVARRRSPLIAVESARHELRNASVPRPPHRTPGGCRQRPVPDGRSVRRKPNSAVRSPRSATCITRPWGTPRTTAPAVVMARAAHPPERRDELLRRCRWSGTVHRHRGNHFDAVDAVANGRVDRGDQSQRKAGAESRASSRLEDVELGDRSPEVGDPCEARPGTRRSATASGCAGDEAAVRRLSCCGSCDDGDDDGEGARSWVNP